MPKACTDGRKRSMCWIPAWEVKNREAAWPTSSCLEAPFPQVQTLSQPWLLASSEGITAWTDLRRTHLHQTTGCTGLPAPFPIGPACSTDSPSTRELLKYWNFSDNTRCVSKIMPSHFMYLPWVIYLFCGSIILNIMTTPRCVISSSVLSLGHQIQVSTYWLSLRHLPLVPNPFLLYRVPCAIDIFAYPVLTLQSHLWFLIPSHSHDRKRAMKDFLKCT